jgi:hypothetical protein
MKKLSDEVEKLNMVAPTSWLEKIDDWRRQQSDLPNRSEAIRQLVEMGLKTSTTKRRSKKS